MYALKNKEKMVLSFFSATEEQLSEKIKRAYWLQRGMQPKGSDYPMSKFMEDKLRVSVTVKILEG
tara:strand:- start:154 stop:348 length:195 start_codon:yes stop_codon:yes gene_type:complete